MIASVAAPLATALAVPAAVPAEAQVRAAAHLSVIRGVVTDAAGHRLAGVQVTAVPYGSLADPRSTTTGQSGGFRVAAGPGDSPCRARRRGPRRRVRRARLLRPGSLRPARPRRRGHRARRGADPPAGRRHGRRAGHRSARPRPDGGLPYLQPVLDYATGSDKYAADDPTVTVRASRNG